MKLLTVTLALFCTALANCDDSSNVISLTAVTFDEFLASHSVVLVEFFAPWCGHCKAMAPEFEAAAKLVKDAKSNAVFANVDGTQERGLLQQFNIRGYPTLLLFVGSQNVAEYEGPRSARMIADFVLAAEKGGFQVAASADLDEEEAEADVEPAPQTGDLRRLVGPAYTTVQSLEDAEMWLRSGKERVVVVCGSKHEFFTQSAEQLKSRFLFVFVEKTSGLEAAGAHADDIIVLSRADDSLADDQDPEAIKINYDAFAGEQKPEVLERFLRTRLVPKFGVLTETNFEQYASSGLPVAVVFAELTDVQTPELIKTVIDHYNAQGIIVGQVDMALFADLASDLGVRENTLPLVILDHHMQRHYVFGSRPRTTEALIQFADEFAANTLPPYRRSQPVPETNDGPVLEVVGSTFEDLVYRDQQDVFIMFYAPWCGHCKALIPKLEKVAKYLKDVPSIVVAKMDATANDPPTRTEFRIEGVPALFFIRTDGKILGYDGSRSVKGLIDFMHKHASVSFEQPTLEASDDHESEPLEADEDAADDFDFGDLPEGGPFAGMSPEEINELLASLGMDPAELRGLEGLGDLGAGLEEQEELEQLFDERPKHEEL